MAKPVKFDDEYVKEIEKARRQLRALILNNNCAPLMLRLAWHDAATYDEKSGTGGPNGSIRTEQELNYAANKGLRKAVQLCEDVKAELKKVSYADLYQLAGVVAVEVTGGPEIDFVPGRKDSYEPSKDDLLPDANLEAPSHLRNVFRRMGLDDQDIVALSGGHTLGEAHKDRSDFEGKWTKDSLKFDNSYFEELLEGKLLRLPTDKALIKDKVFSELVHRFKEDEKAFFKDYATSHKKLSELGYTVKNGSKELSNVRSEKLNLPNRVIGIVMVSSAVIFGYLLKRKINRRKTFESQN